MHRPARAPALRDRRSGNRRRAQRANQGRSSVASGAARGSSALPVPNVRAVCDATAADAVGVTPSSDPPAGLIRFQTMSSATARSVIATMDMDTTSRDRCEACRRRRSRARSRSPPSRAGRSPTEPPVSMQPVAGDPGEQEDDERADAPDRSNGGEIGDVGEDEREDRGDDQAAMPAEPRAGAEQRWKHPISASEAVRPAARRRASRSSHRPSRSAPRSP